MNIPSSDVDARVTSSTGVKNDAGAPSNPPSSASTSVSSTAATSNSDQTSTSPSLPQPPSPRPALGCDEECDARAGVCTNAQCVVGASQILFQQRPNQRYDEYTRGVAVDSTDHVLLGLGLERRPPFGQIDLFVRKLNLEGTLVWERALQTKNPSAITQVKVDGLDRVYVGAQTTSRGYFTFQSLTPEGDLRFSLDLVDHYSHSQFDVDANGNSVVVSVVNPELFECQVDVCKPMVMERLSDAGERVWQRIYTDGEDFRVAFMLDGNIAVASRNPRTNPDYTWMALLDEDGDEIWSQTYVGAEFTAPHAIAAGPDGQVWVAGRTYQAPHWLRRYDADGSLISHVDLTPWSEAVNALVVAPDGTYHVGGSMYDETDQSLGARLTRYSAADEPLWRYEDAVAEMPFERQVFDLAVTSQGHVWTAGVMARGHENAGWWALFAGDAGGVPRTSALSLDELTAPQYPPHDGSNVFTDPDVPECEPSGIAKLSYTGTVGTTEVSATLAPGSTFEPQYIDGISAVNGDIVELVRLEWEEYVVQGSTIALTGGYLVMPNDYDGGDKFLCINEGDLGVLPPSWAPQEGRTLRFRITSGSVSDDCETPGTPQPVDVKACFYRTSGDLD